MVDPKCYKCGEKVGRLILIQHEGRGILIGLFGGLFGGLSIGITLGTLIILLITN